jgi:hypothetical protein
MVAPSYITIVGTVLALAVAILLLSGLALYVAFRVRETLRDEKGKGTRAVKVAFLIGLLFLSGGVFYFFASGFSPAAGSSPTQGVTSTSSSGSATGSTSTTSSTSTQASSGTSTSTAMEVSMSSPSCPSRVTAGSTFTCHITVYNQGGTTFSGATVVSSGDFAMFTFMNCTESVNGGSPTSVQTSSDTIALGSLYPGTTVLSLAVQAPTQSGQYSNAVLTLNAPGLPQPVSVTFSIQVAG